MHGKITFYNPKTKIGTVMDKNKRVYEFDKNGWHDRFNFPSVNMFVDFRSDEGGKINSAKKSAYYILAKKYGIKEQYFWTTKDDLHLQDSVQKELEDLIIKKCKTINIEIPIPSSKSVDEIFDTEYFEHMDLIYRFEYALSKKYEEFRLDYPVMRRFIKSAKENLVDLDGSILEDEFADYEGVLAKCEQLLSTMLGEMHKEREKIFDEVFLKNQLDYQAFLKWQDLAKERIFQIDKILKNLNSDKERYEKILKKDPSRTDRSELEERYKKIVFKSGELTKEQKKLAIKLELNKKRVKEFEHNRYLEFFDEYGFLNEQKKLFGYLRDVMNHVAFLYNYEIYDKASKSVNIHNANSQDYVNMPYSAISLANSYLKNINIGIAAAKDKKLSEYVKKYINHKMVSVAVICAESSMLARIKNLIFKEDIVFYVETAQKSSEALSLLKNKKIDILVFDPSVEIKDEELYEIAAKNNEKMAILYLGQGKEERENVTFHPLPIKESQLRSEVKRMASELGKYLRDKLS